MPKKSLEDRMQEAQEIRRSLEILGALQTTQNKLIFKDVSNAFVRDGSPSTTKLFVADGGVFAKIAFKHKEGVRSGVSLIK